MTLAGVILGTAAYMSPEQAKGLEADQRSDVFAFGLVLYEMLTGRRAFAGDGVSETLAFVITKEPDWARLPPEIPHRIRTRRQRLQAIGEARIAIDSLKSDASDAPTVSGPLPARSRAWPGWVAAALAAAFSVWLWATSTPPGPLVKFQITAPAGSRLPLGTPAISPDGQMIAYVVSSPKRPNVLHVRNLGSTESTPIPGTERVIYAFWSPDSRSLAFWAQGRIRRVDLAGGGPREIGDTVNVWTGSWNQQGQILFRARSPRLPGVTANGLDRETGGLA